MTDHEIELKIEEFFANNFEILKLESGHSITEYGKRVALSQVLCYWHKLKALAMSVTDTEVRLTLPNQKTPKGRVYSIEGVVDIVKEKGETWMYDIKTHDPEYIRANIQFYEDQINVYAYIWEKLRGNSLDKTAVISTAFPRGVRDALYYGGDDRFSKEIEKWNPIIEIRLTVSKVDQTIKDFGKVVDAIENSEFAPPPKKVLEEKVRGSAHIFADRTCRRCDARYSCQSFREYATDAGRKSKVNFAKYIEIEGDDLEQEEWVNANLEILDEQIENNRT